MMPSFLSSPARGELTSKKDTGAPSEPTTSAGSVQSLPGLDESQAVTTESQDNYPSRQSTSRTSVSTSGQHARESKDLPKPSSSTTSRANTGLDPLSTQIYLRTTSNTEPTIAQRLRNPTRPESPRPENSRRSTDLSKASNAPLEANKERRKGSSFLSRLGMRSSWRKDDDMQDSDSELGDLRTDGTYARALTTVIGAGGGYIPLYKEPPRYIRVKAHNTKDRDFNHLFLAQELVGGKRPEQQEQQRRAPQTAVGSKLLSGGDAAIWAAEFSQDGRYLAVAGKDQCIRVFEVISTAEDRKAHEEEEGRTGTAGERLSAPVFRTEPVREFQGHTGDILTLCWSKNNFLLSASMDKTVRLWHMSKTESVCSFVHKDLVTSIAFHPTDDRFFLAGSLDSQLRLWSIPDKSVAYSISAGEFITAVAFTPDGKVAICGTLSGMCTFFDTVGLKVKYQIHVRSSRGKNAKGSKITGIRTLKLPGDSDSKRVKVLVTSNDSRIRVYDLNDKLLQVKFKGLENQSSQIHAYFSDDGKYVICGSEDRKAYIWPLGPDDAEIKDKQPYESFDAHPEVVTNALMAPTATRQLLSASGDPIYDLCNPPPVMLRSLEESMHASQTAFSDSSRGDTPPPLPRRPEESPAYVERCKHYDGHIIVTTDRTGKIKVFRQDCAYAKRQQGLWETGSKFSGRISGVGRSASIITKTSTGSRIHSRRGSLSLAPNPAQTQHPTERINSWRQDIDGGRGSVNGTPTRSERSISPIKASRSPVNVSAATLASEARKQPYVSGTIGRSQNPASPTGSTLSNRMPVRSARDREIDKVMVATPPTPSFSLISASDSENKEEREGSFWNLSRWRSIRNSGIYSSTGSPSGNGASGGHSRSGSELLTPGEKSSARKSMAIGDLNRLRVDEKANRRRSAGPMFTARSTQADARRSMMNDRAGIPEQLTPTKKRVDSGVGRMSAESVEYAQDRKR